MRTQIYKPQEQDRKQAVLYPHAKVPVLHYCLSETEASQTNPVRQQVSTKNATHLLWPFFVYSQESHAKEFFLLVIVYIQPQECTRTLQILLQTAPMLQFTFQRLAVRCEFFKFNSTKCFNRSGGAPLASYPILGIYISTSVTKATLTQDKIRQTCKVIKGEYKYQIL